MEFIDAQKMHKENPETFYAPILPLLKTVIAGSTVKIGIGGERFWVYVKSVNFNELTGTIDNDLVRTDIHGLKCNDEVKFNIINILQIYYGS